MAKKENPKKVKKKNPKKVKKKNPKKVSNQVQSLRQATNAMKSLQKMTDTASVYDTSNPFGFITDEQQIQNTLNAATEAAYNQKRIEAEQGLNRAEDTSYANTQNAIKGLRDSMAASAAGGSNRGAAGANAVQALLGLGQQNNALVTEGLQNIQNVAGEKAAQIAQNAADAIDKSNSAKGSQATAAGEKYAADQSARSAAAQALAGIGSSFHTDVYDYRMNQQTNSANKTIAKTPQKIKNVNINKNS